MGTSIIDGTIEEVVLKRRRKLGRSSRRILFRLDDGTTKTWGRRWSGTMSPTHLKPGLKGRFYLYTAIDHRGIHGLRTADGREIYGFGKQNEIISVVIFFVSAA